MHSKCLFIEEATVFFLAPDLSMSYTFMDKLLKLGMGFVRSVTNISQYTAMQGLYYLIKYSYPVFLLPTYPKAYHKTITLPFMSGQSQTISHLSVLHDFLVKKIKINLHIIKSRPPEIIKVHKETMFYGTYNKYMDISSISRRVHGFKKFYYSKQGMSNLYLFKLKMIFKYHTSSPKIIAFRIKYKLLSSLSFVALQHWLGTLSCVKMI